MAGPWDDYGQSNDSGDEPWREYGAQPPAPKAQGIGDTLIEGTKSTGRAVGAAVNAYTGNGQGIADKAIAQQQAPRDARLEKFQTDFAERTAALGDDPGVLDTIGEGIGAVADNPAGAGLAVVEQLPNAAVALGGGFAGMKAGAAAGAAAGSVLPGVGTAAGGVAGGIVGGLAGMFLGNAALETGNKAMGLADDGEVTPEEMSQARREGAVKGGVITGVDALTLGIGGKVAGTLQRTGRTAIEAATRKALVDRGVDVADQAAVLAARSNPEIAAAVRVAQDNARKATDSLGKRAAVAGTLLGMETVGEGVGEYLGELAATGEGNVPDAVLEGLLSLGQSGAETAFNMRRMVQPSPSAENPAPAPVPSPDPAAGSISRAAAMLPAPDRLALPAPDPVLFADSSGEVSDQGPRRDVDREQRPVPGRQPATGGSGMDQQTPRGELPLSGELIPAARVQQSQPPAEVRTFEADPVRPGIPDLRPEAVIVDAAGQAQAGRVPTQQPVDAPVRRDGMTSQAVPGQRPRFEQVLQQARAAGAQIDAAGLAEVTGATRAQAARAIRGVQVEQQTINTTFKSVPGANKALRELPEPGAFEVVKSGNREWRIQRRQEVQDADNRAGATDVGAASDLPAAPASVDNVARVPAVDERPAVAGPAAEPGGVDIPATAEGADGQRALSTDTEGAEGADTSNEVPSRQSTPARQSKPTRAVTPADQSVSTETEQDNAGASEEAQALPEILATPRKRYIDRQAKTSGLKKGSPGYDQAIQRLQDQYEADIDRASAGLTFEQYNALNKDSPEGVNRQAWEALRREFEPAYSRGSYRRGPVAGRGSRAVQLRLQLQRLTGGWQNAPDIKVVQSVKDLPDAQRRQVERDGAFDVEGMFADGQVYLVADNLRGVKHAAFVLQHEVLGHAGLQGAYGQRLKPLLMSLYNSNAELKQQADQLTKKFGYEPALAMEEVLADMAAAGTIARQSFWPRLVTAMRNALRSIGLNLSWSEGDIQSLLANARGYIINGRRRPGARDAFSRDGRSGRGPEIADEQGRLLAPNGKPSKLNQKQWHQVRSESFEKWFGDWQAAAVGLRLEKAKPLRLATPESWKGLGIKDRQAKVLELLRGFVASGETLQHDILGEVRLNNNGAKKASSTSADPAKHAVLARVQDAIRHAEYSRWDFDNKGREGMAHHKLIMPVSVDGVPLYVVFNVRDDANGRRLHNLATLDRKEEALAVSPREMTREGQRSTSANTKAPADFVRRPLERVNPDNVSKVTDSNGEPLILYHGTAEEFSVFDQTRAGRSTGHTTAPLGIFLTSDGELAKAYAEKATDGMPGLANVMPLFVQIKKPYVMSVAESQRLDTPDKAIAFRQKLEREGYDGVRLADTGTWVAFYNNQVKSATNNTGAFDQVDPDIRYSRAGQRDTEALRKIGLAGSEAQNLLDQVRNVTLGGLQAKLSEWSTRSEEGIFDGLAGIRRAEEAVGVTDINKQGYVSARMASGIADVMHGVLHYAAPEWRDGVVSGKAGTRGVLEILGDLGQDNLTPWLAWLGGKRTVA
nr:hypothetical protein [uncultured Pseudomonas sp.]